MRRRVVFEVTMALLLISALLIFYSGIKQAEAPGTIIIKADGSIDPPSANITTSDLVNYLFTDNNYDRIVVERDNIIIDGRGFTLEGPSTWTVQSGSGFYLESRRGVTIKNVLVRGWRWGILVNNTSTEITITDNRIADNMMGISVIDSHFNTVFRNSVTNSSEGGIILEYATYNNVHENNVAGTNPQYNPFFGAGILVGAYARYNTIQSNHLSDNYRGIKVYRAMDNVLDGNEMVNNTYNFGISSADTLGFGKLSDFLNDISPSNTVDGKPVYLWINVQNAIVPSDAGYLALVNCTNITVQDLNLTRNEHGLFLGWTMNSLVLNNSLTSNEAGVYLDHSTSINVTENNVKYNGGGIVLDTSRADFSRNSVSSNYFGFKLAYADQNVISDNNIESNSQHGIYVSVSSDYSNISGNIIVNNGYGVYVHGSPFISDYSRNTTVSGNEITKNSYGVYLVYSRNTKIYHNSFVNNTVHAFSYSSVNSSWDDGYPSGGNLWGGYYDVDSFSGPNQNVSGSDGIWDNPYVIDSSNEDRYPFTPSYHTLTIDPAAGGTTNPPTGSYTYYEGEIATVLAIPDVGYSFDHWEYRDQTSTENPLTMTLSQDITLLPVFYVSSPPPAVPEFPAGLALEIFLIPVIIYMLWRNKQRKRLLP